MKTKIIYEDEALLVIDKPAGVATQTGKIGQQDVVSELKNYLGKAQKGQPYLGVVHRLDQPVEGLLVFGKTKQATAKLSAQLATIALHKNYYAVVNTKNRPESQGERQQDCGKALQKSGELVDYMYKTADNRAEIVTGTQDEVSQAKKAVLQYQILEELSDGIALVDIFLQTGRFHQIRAQMAHAGMALLGDAKYADEDTREQSRQYRVRNVALCAYSVDFIHPVTGKKMHFQVSPKGEIFSRFSFRTI